jgi:hypothetical protein
MIIEKKALFAFAIHSKYIKISLYELVHFTISHAIYIQLDRDHSYFA